MIKRKAEAIWIESLNQWMVKVQLNGTRKAFYSGTKGRKGKHEAENKADEWIRKGTEDIKFEDAWAVFLADQKERTGTSNYAKHESVGRLHILPIMKKFKLSAVTPVMWQECINTAASKGLSRRTCIGIRGSISAFCTYARRARWEIIPLVDGDIIIPNSTKPAVEKTILQPDDIRTLFSVDTIKKSGKIVKAHYIYAWRFLVATGLRRGELCGLKNEDIQGDIVTIRRSINEYCEETNGKNDNARRSFKLTPIAKQILTDQRNYIKSLGIISPWVFPDEYGEMPIPKSVSDRWRFYCGQHGFKCTIHELRHTFISISKNDLPIELMKQVVGHSSNMDTYGVYGHDVQGESERAADIIEGVFEGILKKP